MRKATPAQSQLPVRNQTTMAMMAAGRKRKTIFTTAMRMIAPIIKRISKARISSKGGKLGSGKGGAKATHPSTKLEYEQCTALKF